MIGPTAELGNAGAPPVAVRNPVDVKRVQRSWGRTRFVLLLVVDLVAAFWATSAATFTRYELGLRELPANVSMTDSSFTVSYSTFALCTVAVWLVMLMATGTYAPSRRWSLWEQCTGIGRSAVGSLAVVGVVALLTRLQVSRAFVLVSLAALVLLTAFGRLCVLVLFRALMRLGIGTERVVLVGPRQDVAELRAHLRRTSRHVRVVGEVVPDGLDVDELCTQLSAQCRELGITSVVATDHAIPAGGTRELAAVLRDVGVTTLVAPGTREVLGPSLHLHAVGELFLLRVSTGHRPALQRWLKGALDRVLAAVGLVVLGPLLIGLSIAIRRDGGPACSVSGASEATASPSPS